MFIFYYLFERFNFLIENYFWQEKKRMNFLSIQLIVCFAYLINTIYPACIHDQPNNDKRHPTLLISLDGFRADKLDEFLRQRPNSNLKKYFVNAGVKADYMIPAFPSLTFPNHFTLVTGLYMESHGLVGNAIYDPKLEDRVNFMSSDPSALNEKWWKEAGL